MSNQPENQLPPKEKDVLDGEPKMTMKQKARIVVISLLGILLITFTAQNWNPVVVEFLNMNFEIRIIFIILGSAILGALINFLLMKHRAAVKRKKK
ncbi:MAG: DUF1049 domain-containing protein [Crocinitomix sp.]|nr:DUF1049 domain-containing protein [Crocinitomix sp.]